MKRELFISSDALNTEMLIRKDGTIYFLGYIWPILEETIK
jgi:hypothetical protein